MFFSALIKQSYAVDTNSFACDTAIGGMFLFRRTTLSDIIFISDRVIENVYFYIISGDLYNFILYYV